MPNSRRNLDMAIQRAYGAGIALAESRKLMANVVVGQFLPEGVVKGGSSIRLRYGKAATRFTVKPTLDEAVRWANGFISEIDNSRWAKG